MRDDPRGRWDDEAEANGLLARVADHAPERVSGMRLPSASATASTGIPSWSSTTEKLVLRTDVLDAP